MKAHVILKNAIITKLDGVNYQGVVACASVNAMNRGPIHSQQYHYFLNRPLKQDAPFLEIKYTLTCISEMSSIL